MNVIALDIPLLIGGLVALFWVRLFRPAYVFQIACQFVSTFWAQYSWGVSWSLGKLVPILAGTTVSGRPLRHGKLFLPFAVYVAVGGLLSAIFWKIPVGVEFAYGEGRSFVQLVNFAALVFATIAFAQAVSDEEGVVLMWKALVLLGLVHGLASVYQYVASLSGLPLIGISRAHGLTFEPGAAGDLAAFEAGGGITILRPGGLAGEPKTVAIVFGLVLLSGAAIQLPSIVTKWWRILARVSILLSLIGLVGAFSTSVFVGLTAAYLLLIASRMISLSRAISIFLTLAGCVLLADYSLHWLGLPDLERLLTLRTLDRLSNSAELDPVVQAAVSAMLQNPILFLFGTGNGGGSFRIMEVLGQRFELSLAPSIGLVDLLLEFGLLGTALLLTPFFVLTLLVVRKARFRKDLLNTWPLVFLAVVGISAMALMLTGAGIPLGYPLAVGSILGAAQYPTPLRGSPQMGPR